MIPIPPRKKLLTPPPRIPKREVFRLAEQESLFDAQTEWQQEWKGMPEFVSVDKAPFHTVHVHLANLKDLEDFAKLMGQKITIETKYVWHPKWKVVKVADLRYDAKGEAECLTQDEHKEYWELLDSLEHPDGAYLSRAQDFTKRMYAKYGEAPAKRMFAGVSQAWKAVQEAVGK